MADLSRLTDDQLLAATKDNSEAFGVFYTRHSKRILGFFGRATGDVETALDLTEEVFTDALDAVLRDRYRPGEAPAGAWLFGIARNKLAEARRRDALDDSAHQRIGVPAVESSESTIDEALRFLDPAASGYVRAMNRLSAGERDAIMARVVEEREYAEIAHAAGMTESAIRKRVSRGLAKLARLITRSD